MGEVANVCYLVRPPGFYEIFISGSFTIECNQEFTPESAAHIDDLARVFTRYGPSARICTTVVGNRMPENAWESKITPQEYPPVKPFSTIFSM